jgi:hypothetical protein
MKVGYRQAAWRLFQVTLTPLPQRTVRVTWTDTELEGTPFQKTRLPLPVVRPRARTSGAPRVLLRSDLISRRP